MNKYRILLADDHAIVRAGIRKTLEEIPDIEVVAEAGDGPQVFLTLEQYRIDCLMIDVTMPDFEPISAIQQIRERYPDMKILIVSAYDDDVYVQGLLGVGVNGYHLKDQPLNDLRLALQRIRAGELWLSPPLINKLLGISQRAAELPSLTNRQRDLLQLLQEGKDNQTIAQEMDLSIKTVENHLTRLYRLLNVQSRLEAANYILRYPQILGIKGQQLTCAAILINFNFKKHLCFSGGRQYPLSKSFAACNKQDRSAGGHLWSGEYPQRSSFGRARSASIDLDRCRSKRRRWNQLCQTD